MSDTLKLKLSQASTWRGIFNAIGGAASIGLVLLDPTISAKVIVIINAITFLITGIIGALTDDSEPITNVVKKPEGY